MGYGFVVMKPIRLTTLTLLSVFLLASCGETSSSSVASSVEESVTTSEVVASTGETSSSSVASSVEESVTTSEVVASTGEATSSKEEVTSVAPASSAEATSVSKPADDYGWKVNYNEYGKTFATTLASLITGKTTSYSNCLDVGAKAAAYPTESSTSFIPFYHEAKASEVATTGECNREHTWPDSRGGGKIEKDPIVIRPTLNKDNSSRGNNYYGIGSGQWDPASCGYEGARGEAARIILYAATRYASLGLSLNNDTTYVKGKSMSMGTLYKLLEWNLQYRPTDFEKTVNERYAKMGYARNPFVDCPEFANYIYDDEGYRTSPYNGGQPVTSGSQASSSSKEDPVLEGEWTLVETASEIEAGDEIIFAHTASKMIAGPVFNTSTAKFMGTTSGVFSSDGKTVNTVAEDAFVFTVGISGSTYTFDTKSGLMGATADKNIAFGSGTTDWTLSITDGDAVISNVNSDYGRIAYNTDSPRFGNYTSTRTMIVPIQIYKAA